MTRNNAIKTLEILLAAANDTLEKFATGISEDPYQNMRFSKPAFRAAAVVEVYPEYLAILNNPAYHQKTAYLRAVSSLRYLSSNLHTASGSAGMLKAEVVHVLANLTYIFDSFKVVE